MKLPRLMEGPAWLVWALYAALLVVLMWGGFETSVAEGYFDTAEAWWTAERDIYTDGIAGYLYPPQSLYVFTPFTWVPRDVGHALWRLLGLALLAFGIRRAAVHLPGNRANEMFALATLLVVSCSVGATKTGQSNLHLAGGVLLAAAALANRRWGAATGWLLLGLLMKPLGLVLLLLAAVLYRPMAARLAIALIVFAALPFAHPDTSYALRQYELGLDKLVRASQPGEKPYADLVGLLRTAGIQVAPALRTALQATAAVATLALCWAALERRGREVGALLAAAFAAAYLVLFNPRTETNSYVLLAPCIALATGVALLVRRRHAWATVGVIACVLLGSDNYGRAFHEATTPWLKPLIALLFAGVLVRLATRRPSDAS